MEVGAATEVTEGTEQDQHGEAETRRRTKEFKQYRAGPTPLVTPAKGRRRALAAAPCLRASVLGLIRALRHLRALAMALALLAIVPAAEAAAGTQRVTIRTPCCNTAMPREVPHNVGGQRVCWIER